MEKMPLYIIVESKARVAYFRKHLPMVNGVGGDAFLIEMLNGLSEAIWDWPQRWANTEELVSQTIQHCEYIEHFPSMALSLTKSVFGLLRAIDQAVETHNLTLIGIFPYRFHQLLGDTIVMAFYPD